MKRKYKGILYILAAAFCFALMNLFVRLSGDLPSVQKSFFRNFVALIFAGIIISKSHVKFSGDRKNMLLLIFRSIFGTIGILCNFYAVDHLVLADATMLNKMSPFFAIFFSWLILKERISFLQGFAVFTAFVGSLCIIKPTMLNIDIMPAFIGLLGGMSAGAAYTLVRLLGMRKENGAFIVFFFSGFSCLVTLPSLIFQYHAMSFMQVGILLLAGLFAAGGQFAITAAYHHAPAKEISVYDYSQVIFSAALGFIIFGQIPDALSWLGYALICGMAMMMYLHQKKA